MPVSEVSGVSHSVWWRMGSIQPLLLPSTPSARGGGAGSGWEVNAGESGPLQLSEPGAFPPGSRIPVPFMCSQDLGVGGWVCGGRNEEHRHKCKWQPLERPGEGQGTSGNGGQWHGRTRRERDNRQQSPMRRASLHRGRVIQPTAQFPRISRRTPAPQFQTIHPLSPPKVRAATLMLLGQEDRRVHPLLGRNWVRALRAMEGAVPVGQSPPGRLPTRISGTHLGGMVDPFRPI